MIGLLYKDFLVIRKTLTYYLVFIAVYAVLVISGAFDLSILPALIVVFSMMLPMASVGYDDQAHWGAFAATTPAGRTGVVTAKYLFAALCTLGAAVLVALLIWILALLNLARADAAEMRFILPSCIGVGLLINAVILPLLFKFGTEKSRIISMIILVSVFGGIFLLSKLPVAYPALPSWLPAALPALLSIVVLGGFLLSYLIAQKIYAKKSL